MAEQIKQRWQLATLRACCAFVAVFLHVWAVSAPLAVVAVTQAAEQAQSAAKKRGMVAFSIMTMASPTKPVMKPAASVVKREQPVAEATAKPIRWTKPAEPVVAKPAQKTATDTAVHEAAKLFKQETPKEEISTDRAIADAAPAALSPSQTQAGVHALVEMSEPKFVSPPSPPTYPTLARKRGQEGTVWLDIVLDAQGTQSQLHILKSSGVAVLDTAALSAVSRWRFRPYEISGVGRPSRVRIPIEFSLN